MTKFFNDPKNLRYSLNTIIPVVVFLTSILAAVTARSFYTDPVTDYIWIISVSLFAALCSLFVVLAVTLPLKELLARAERLVRFQGKKSERGQMIEVYQLIERLIELVKSEETGKHGDKINAIEGIERLDYLLPLGYMSLMVAHEVRNPLSTITGMSELLKEKMEGPETKAYVDVILDAARKIDIFTKELLDFTDAGLETDEVDVNRIVDEVLKTVANDFKEVEFEFEKGDAVLFIGDSNKLFQAIHNIIKNAFEYESKGGMGGFVRVKTDFSDPITISVSNKSSSIDENDIDSIFKPFFTKKKGGKGLGLFIAMRNVKLHGGDIKVKSGEDGTMFTIQLPGEIVNSE
ncbi:MAG: HAMP domain-containing sensor histidine kinase [Proteobacteria bacterium]|nr:HAMP domain-containing sensor histidine kinase [Pseudomonadota bacterium]